MPQSGRRQARNVRQACWGIQHVGVGCWCRRGRRQGQLCVSVCVVSVLVLALLMVKFYFAAPANAFFVAGQFNWQVWKEFVRYASSAVLWRNYLAAQLWRTTGMQFRPTVVWQCVYRISWLEPDSSLSYNWNGSFPTIFMITSAAEYKNLLRGNSLHIKLNDDDILHLSMRRSSPFFLLCR